MGSLELALTEIASFFHPATLIPMTVSTFRNTLHCRQLPESLNKCLPGGRTPATIYQIADALRRKKNIG
jgi:hypothetical protein